MAEVNEEMHNILLEDAWASFQRLYYAAKRLTLAAESMMVQSTTVAHIDADGIPEDDPATVIVHPAAMDLVRAAAAYAEASERPFAG